MDMVLLFMLLGSMATPMTNGDWIAGIAPRQFKALDYLGTSIRSTAANGQPGQASHYFMSVERATWTTARLKCPLRTNGLGHLLQIEDEAEDSIVNDLIRTQDPKPKVAEYLWTDGVSDKVGKWWWYSSNLPFNYTHFKVTPSSPALYLSFISLSVNEYEWSGAQGNEEQLHFICEVNEQCFKTPKVSTPVYCSRNESAAPTAPSIESCSPNFGEPINLQRMQDALVTDPMAEHKFHFDCVPEEKSGNGAVPPTDGARLNLKECANPSRILPGLEHVEFGYNIVTDQVYSYPKYIQVLDLTSRDKFNATVRDPQSSRCWKVPDALVSISKGTIGVRYHPYSSNSFNAIGADTMEGYRKKMVGVMAAELGLGSQLVGDEGRRAAFAHSTTTKELRDAKGHDALVIEYLELYYGVTIETPKPTTQLIQRWMGLAELGNSKSSEVAAKFDRYFEEVGTHYFVSTVMGGKLRAVFTTRSRIYQELDSAAQDRAECIAKKSEASFLGLDPKIASTICEKSYAKLSGTKLTSEFAESISIHCLGGRASDCPPDLDYSKDTFEEWRKSVALVPVPTYGAKKWTHELIDHILENYRESAIYKGIVLEFADVDEMDLPQAARGLQRFRHILVTQLKRYLEKNGCKDEVCAKKPINSWPLQPNRAGEGGHDWVKGGEDGGKRKEEV